jgi:hypothetical protein
MTNKITKEFLFTELSIKIATLEMKLDKVLELLNKSEYEIVNVVNVKDHLHVGINDVVRSFNTSPPQWPNESHTDYLKRIGQYNEASSDNENFEDNYK